ncbi:hypothetical protein M8D79_004225 [Salmonella enterica]|nr:hypothetical protein [Salmonella enterica]EDV2893486.1 hypothetical protein [Salmonella enterica subsp. diarizonae]EJF2534746.1 hypothetical protein [Salmonella enterica]
MTLLIQSEPYIIGIEKALDDSERTVGNIIEPQKDGTLHVAATFNGAVATVIEDLANKARVAEERVKRLEAQQRKISLKPHVYRELVNQLRDTAVKYAGCQQLRAQISRTLQHAMEADNTMPGLDRDWADEVLALDTSPTPKPLPLANETMDVDRLREIAEEDNGSDVAFESSVMARMLLSVALNSDPVAYTDTEELESLEGIDGHSYAHLWPNAYGFGKDIPLYTVPQMMLPPVCFLDDETNREVFEAWVADYTGHTKGFVSQFRMEDKYRSDSMWNKYWNTWNACRDFMRKANLLEIPDIWISRAKQMPDPTSEKRVCAFTPTERDDLRYRFVPASLFKIVCSDATHWFYMLPPLGQEEVAGG